MRSWRSLIAVVFLCLAVLFATADVSAKGSRTGRRSSTTHSRSTRVPRVGSTAPRSTTRTYTLRRRSRTSTSLATRAPRTHSTARTSTPGTRAPRTASRVRSATSRTSAPRTTAPRSSRAAAGVTRNSRGRIARSEEAKRAFMRQTGYANGRPGYVVDHIKPLACGGADAPSNMQWQTVEAAKAKDKVERKGC